MQTAPVEAPLQSSSLPRWAPFLFLIASFLISLAFLGVRNIYDDEIGTTDLLRVPIRQIVVMMNNADVHPPGMYVLAHLGYQLVPSARWVTIFPLTCLYLGLSIFVLAYEPILQTRLTQICFLLFATFHPQLLMWGNSIRWYPWWSGVALLAVVVGLQPRVAQATFRVPRALAVGLLLGCLFYLNYITIIFSVALAVALVFRYGRRAWRQLLVVAAVMLVVIAPQLHAFLTVHLRGSGGQRSNPLLSVARLVQSLFSSEAYLPWHPLAIMAALLFLVLAGIGLAAAIRLLRRETVEAIRNREPALASIVVFSLTFFALVAVSGLGGKPRNGMALVPLLAPAVALVVGGLRSRVAQWSVIVFLVIWSGVGISHLLRREGLTKSGMNNRPEEVLHFIEASRGDRCSVVVTYDPILSFYLVQSGLPRQLVLTSSQNTLYRDAAPFQAETCAGLELYVVQSYLGGFGDYETIFPRQLSEAVRFIEPSVQVHSFSYDPEARFKRRLRFVEGTSTLPDYRYVVDSGALAVTDLKPLESRLSYFAAADGYSLPKAQ